MSTATVAKPQAQQPGKGSRRFSLPVLLLIIAGVLILTSAVRLITGADGITSTGQMSTALRLAVPIGLAGLGGLWSERAGVVNIGLEGMMILGTWFGAWAGYQWGPWTGVAFGIIGGVLGGILHAIATVTFNVNHIVSGVAINILALGTTRYLSKFTFENAPQGSSKQSPPIDSLGTFDIPGLSSGLDTLNGKHWFLISDIAGLLGGLVTDLSPLTVVAVASYRRRGGCCGVRPSACGCAPAARTRWPPSPRRQRLQVQVPRRDHLRWLRRPRRCLPVDRRVQRVPGRSDGRPRIHRSRRDDLR